MRKLFLLQKKVSPAAKHLLAFFAIVITTYACKKEIKQQPADPALQQPVASIAAAAPSAYCSEDVENGLAMTVF
jgi:hypothetical protein